MILNRRSKIITEDHKQKILRQQVLNRRSFLNKRKMTSCKREIHMKITQVPYSIFEIASITRLVQTLFDRILEHIHCTWPPYKAMRFKIPSTSAHSFQKATIGVQVVHLSPHQITTEMWNLFNIFSHFRQERARNKKDTRTGTCLCVFGVSSPGNLSREAVNGARQFSLRCVKVNVSQNKISM